MKKVTSFVLMFILLISCFVIPAFAATPTLRKGAKGNDVLWHQKTMNFLGFDCGAANGIYGDKTISATKAFQKAFALEDDGIAGSKTLSKERDLVKGIQQKLNDLGYGKLSIDGLPGDKTIKALKQFQKDFKLSETGICDNLTLQNLNDSSMADFSDVQEQIKEFEEACKKSWVLPLVEDFKSITGSREFASLRDKGNRAHAGIDFVAAAGTTVYAMTSGTVLQVYTFYESTKAVEVQNDDGSILRYCEILPDVKAGDKVEQGDIIGTIMRATGGTEMLHLELYRGDASGGLTQRSNKEYMYVDSNYNFQRRSDLMDPTFLQDLDSLE